ncbi:MULTISPECIES: MFS transporter [Brevibacterium]|uniref:MFS transporter n=1 Tax=Brevibacterium TaxID=1696 RepID=UPI001BAAB499|nr:MFS transporter [Brevibacterium sp. W7.2]
MRTTGRTFRHNQWALSLAQLFAGIGVATGFAVGGILAERLTGRTELAGFAQTASILGAGLLALPLARLAAARNRRWALGVGYGLALIGALLIVAAILAGISLLFFVGMGCFGSATAAGLQSRYAATDAAPANLKGRAMSLVVWATTVGSVVGPNLAEPGARLGEALGIDPFAGPFLIAVAGYLLSFVCVMFLRTPAVYSPAEVPASVASPQPGATVGGSAEGETPVEQVSVGDVRTAASVTESSRRGGAWRAVRRSPGALFGLLSVVTGHMIMVSTMVMTPVHMDHQGFGLGVIGVTIAGHIFGMYGLSPVFGYLTDRFSPGRVIALGQALFALALVLGFIDAAGESSFTRISIALFVLGLGWSACLIAGSTLLTQDTDEAHRIEVQGLSDAGMNLGAAAVAACAGPLLALGGFAWITVLGALVLMVAVVVGLRTGYGTRAHT